MKEANSSKTEWKQDNHWAIYVDILGSSKRLEAAGKNVYNLLEIAKDTESFYNEFVDYFYKKYGQQSSLGKVYTFSDGVYISIPENKKDWEDLDDYERVREKLVDVGFAQTRLIIGHGLFLRGGIFCGKRVYDINETVEASSAYYKAYKIEEEEAEYPIVKLDQSTAQKVYSLPGVKTYNDNWEPKTPGSIFWKATISDSEDIYFLDYLQCFFSVCGDDFGKDDHYNALSNHKIQIINAYKENADNLRVALKYAFLAHKYHNEYVEWKSKMLCLESFKDLLIKETEVPFFESLKKQIKTAKENSH